MIGRTGPRSASGRSTAALLLLLIGVIACRPSDKTAPDPADPSVDVVLSTPMGNITVRLEPERAPVSTANFLRYVDAGLYDGGRFHRTVHLDNQPDNDVPIEVIQGGINPRRASEDGAPIPLERTDATGLSHVDGTISMARDGPDTATSDFFICVGDQPELDFGGRRNPDGQGFGAFGRVVDGMEAVRAIQRAPAEGQSLTPVVPILRVRRVGKGVFE